MVRAKKPPSAGAPHAIAVVVVCAAATLIVLPIDAAYRRSGRTVPQAIGKLEWIIGGVTGAVAGAMSFPSRAGQSRERSLRLPTETR